MQTAVATGGTPLLPRLRRATADETLLRANQYAAAAAAGGRTSGGTHAGSRALIRQLSIPAGAAAAVQQQPGAMWGGPTRNSSLSQAGRGDAAVQALPPAAGTGRGMSALGFSRVQQASAPLAVLGPGSLLGENVLGYNAEQVRTHDASIIRMCKRAT